MELFNGIGYALHNGYGMSEIGITSVELRDKPKERNCNSVGRPMKSVEYRISEHGTLQVRGQSTCKAVMVNGRYQPMDEWFETGDVMECDDNGFYYIKGRMGDVVIGENGENINPDVLEQNFQLSDAISFSILGLVGEKGKEQEVLSMIVCIHKYLPADRILRMMEYIYEENEKLPMVSRIRQFYFTYDELAPATAIKVGRKYVLRGLENGTIHLIDFREMKDKVQDLAENPISPELANKVRSVIAQELGISEEEIKDDTHILQDLGASSLEYFAMIQELVEEFGIQAENETDAYKYTVREICEYIEQHI
jgi:acyl carrier protein